MNLLDFQTEYEILTSINNDKILEIAFEFKNHKLKVYFFSKNSNEFLTLVCEKDKKIFVKNYVIYFKNGTANINIYWGKYYKHAADLANSDDGTFSEFQEKLKQAIQSVVKTNDEFEISTLNVTTGLQIIKNATSRSAFSKEKVYFHYVKRVPISPIQYKKVSELIGVNVADYLKYSKITAVFTDDITKQRTFVIAPD